MIVKPQPRHPFLKPVTLRKRLRQAVYLSLTLAAAFLAGVISDYSPPSAVFNMSQVNLQRYIAGKLSDPMRIGIDIKYKDYQRLAYERVQAMQRGIIETTDNSYVPAKVTHDGKTAKAKIRLKGDFADHLEGEKWSLRVKIKGDDAVMGMKQFSIQNPQRSGWVNEWIMHELLRHEGLIALRYDYVGITINGKDMGIYALEESFGKELLAHNERREGPLLKFDESAQIDTEKLGPSERVTQADVFYLADIISFNTNNTYADETLRREFLVGRQLLSDFRARKKPASEVFDVDKTARLLALIDVLQAQHAVRWKNIRFYFNPVTHRIEPIAYNAYGPGLGLRRLEALSYHSWVEKALHVTQVSEWLGLFFEDETLAQAYFRELARLTRPGYLDSVLSALEPRLTQKLNIIYKDYPFLNAEAKGYLRQYLRNRDRAYALLQTKMPLKVYLVRAPPSAGRIGLSVANPAFSPVELLALECQSDGTSFADIEPNRLDGKVASKPLRYISVSVTPEASVSPGCFKGAIRRGRNMIIDGLRLKYRVSISGAAVSAPVEFHPLGGHISAPLPGEGIFRGQATAGMLERDEVMREVRVHQGHWVVRSDIVIPRGFVLRIDGGTTIDLRQRSSIIAYGPLMFSGTDDKPILIRSSDSSGQGIAVLYAGERSSIRGVVFENLAAPGRGDWRITGAVTFYESDVDVKRSTFRDARAEDALNIVRSGFRIVGSSFTGAASDAIDVDFGAGSIIATAFTRCGNDCIDTAGSEVTLKDITIDGAGDKAVSVGEQSGVTAVGLRISGAEIGLVSKDSSKIAASSVSITDGAVGLAGYQKKTAFGPSSIEINGLHTHNLGTEYLLEQLSLISVDGAALQPNSRKLKELMYGVKYGKASTS